MTNINYSLSIKLGKILKQKGLKVSVAESCTGGGLAEEITAVAGSSAYFNRGFVVYSNEAKQECLSVSKESLDEHGAVSEVVAREMAQGLLKHTDADLCVSITGTAGPSGGTVEKPVGTVCFGLVTKEGRCDSSREFFTSGRKHIRSNAICFALDWLLNAATEHK
ncbi:MAG: CinA family protein [Gammaproteobacteria bacterium]|nr:CinA family protein [Gammaproteobacteria bacterium]MCH9744297.1 CinA family protein [Gammaproteobacteria bacterium]